MALEILIVGAGIAGLTSALALRRAGHIVHLYERSSLNNEVGAAIHVASNASRPLLAWGLDATRAKFITVKSSFRATGDTLEKFHVVPSYKTEEKFNGPWFLTHRVDLHEELKRMATGEQGRGIPATVHLQSEVVQYDPDRPSIKLADGTVVQGNVVLAADGVHSRGVQAVLGRVNPAYPQELYNFCYRFLIPADEIERDPETRYWNEGDDGRIKFFVGDAKRVVSYPCRNNEVHNFVALFHDDQPLPEKREDWQASVDKNKLLERYSDFHPSILAVLNKATEVKQWPLLFREPISTWHKGSMALVGDAAHPMLPHQGQGGAQGIEDGVAIGIVLSGAKPDDVPARLKVYEAIRKNRASVMQIFSNAGQDEPELIQKEAAKYIPVENVPKSPEEFNYFNLGYDVVKDSVQHLRKLDPSFALPPFFFDKEPGRGAFP